MKNAIGKWTQLELTREEQLELAFMLEAEAKTIRQVFCGDCESCPLQRRCAPLISALALN